MEQLLRSCAASKKIFLTLFLCLMVANVYGAGTINTGWFGSVAIKGYDPVAYLVEGKAVKGSSDHEVEWQEATWRFSSMANKQAFEKEPERFAPQYGGYCAYAVANNSLAGIDPEQFTIVNDKLYLNYNAKIQKQWLDDRDAFIERADGNWPAVVAD